MERPGPLTALASVVVCSGAILISLFAVLLRMIDCNDESYSRCSTVGLIQLVLALAGLVPAVGGAVASAGRLSRSWRWMGVAVLVYAIWAAFVDMKIGW